MFQRKPNLTEEERKQLICVREIYIAGIKDRSIAPDNFKSNIAYLKQLKTACQIWMSVMQPHMEKVLKKMEHGFQHHINVIVLAILGRAVYSEYNAIEEAQKIVFTSDIKQLVKTEFAKEPRITALNYNENYNRNEKTVNGHLEISDTDIVDFSITFSDGFILTLHSLDDEQELARARELFESKMQELSNEHRLGCH